jgi:crotonobetainyl-CoA:carnitine CoA-transferase CaiB-like acyl-CoA transferase
VDRVLELGGIAAGYCGRLLARAGHDVVRAEAGPGAPGWASSAAMEAFLHAGKRRVSTADGGLLAELAGAADVVVAEARCASEIEALGLDDWKAPVKLTITPFGRSGPGRDWPATPHVLLAMGGQTALMGDPDRAPLSLPGHYAEFQTGQYACTIINACRLAGIRDDVDLSMLETVLSLSQFTTAQWHCLGLERTRHGNDYWWVAPMNMFRVRDGWVYVNVTPDFWDAFTVFLGHPELTLDPRFISNERRRENREALHAVIRAAMAPMSRAEAERRAAECRIPVGAVRSFEEVLTDPHLGARGFWETVTIPDVGTLRRPGSAFRFHRDAADGETPDRG